MRPRPTEPLLDAAEPPAFEIVNAAGSGRAVLFCDHASNRIPRRLGSIADAYRLGPGRGGAGSPTFRQARRTAGAERLALAFRSIEAEALAVGPGATA